MIAWLKAELARIKLAEHQLLLRRVHLTTLIGLVLLAGVIGLVVGFGAGYKLPYRTVPRPALAPGQTVPKSSSPQCAGDQHVMGGCLPHRPAPKISLSASITQTNQGPDVSNNDPLSCDQIRIVAAHNAFLELKVNQGTYYTDRTAAAQAACAHIFHLVVGGYDFLDVCRAAPQAEADKFVGLLVVDRLLGPGTLPPTGDAEYPLGAVSCNARSWISAWVSEVHRLTGRQPMIYSGAWWWNPHVGSWFPFPSLAWVSGYTASLGSVPRLAGNGHIDIWQASDHRSNGATYADLSYWLGGASAFRTASLGGPSPEQVRGWIRARGGSLHAFYRRGCRRPVLTSGVCGQLGWRVDHFQKLVDSAHGYYPRCFGRHRNLGAAECQIVRRAVATWSGAVKSSHRAYFAKHCVPPSTRGVCGTFRHEEFYFQGRINRTLATSRY